MRTMVIVAHQDDETLSCGGLIQRRTREGHDVRVVVLYGRKYDYGDTQHKDEQTVDFQTACVVLGVQTYRCYDMEEGEPGKTGYYATLKAIEHELQAYQPDEVLIPSPTDLNQDHRMLAHCCQIALRPANLGNVSRILTWHGLEGQVRPELNWYMGLSDLELAVKMKAVDAYVREGRTLPHARAPENVVAYHRIVGSRCGRVYAEGYTLVLEKS